MKRLPRAAFLGLLALAAVLIGLASLRTGAVSVSWSEMFHPSSSTAGAVFLNLRLPRIVLGFLCGGILGLCGAALQGLFRNPLADPALIGVSGGAALGAVSAIVLFGSWAASSLFVLPAAAFGGALAAAVLVHGIARANGRVLVSTLLLAGIAVNALTGAGIGWMVYGANDQQLRDFTFWSLGSLAGSGWMPVQVCLPLVALSAFILLAAARSLNALSLGEADAWHLGTPVESIKIRLLAATALGVGGVTAFTGTIGFIGLVAPHLVRLASGADHRVVLPGSFLIGGCLLLLADLVARTVRAPAEIPVGVVVATVGAPFFLALLLRGRGHGL
ncbi:MAG: iron ABC transporter permease [Terrimicrobiaceae bacterium]|nr:iron ABC transporter permease [Terrimicrobiaceae bacterium]